MGDVRDQLRTLQQAVARAERALEEAWRMLTEELSDELRGETQPDAATVTGIGEQRAAAD
jgi:hypothetical protein